MNSRTAPDDRPTTAIVVDLLRKSDNPRRLLYALTANPPAAPFEVVVRDHCGCEAVALDLSRFRPVLPVVHVLSTEPGFQNPGYCPKTIIFVPPYAIPVGDAVERARRGHPVACLDAGVAAVEGLDGWGTNLSAGMLADATPLAGEWVRVAGAGTIPGPAEPAVFLLLVPPEAHAPLPDQPGRAGP